MTDEADPASQEEEASAREAARRRRRRARVFGEVLPEATTDDLDEPSADAGERGSDEWLRRQVPPHHG